MDQKLLPRIKKQLASEFYLMNDDWLRGCIEYYVSERQNAQPSYKEVLEFVKAQWVLSDLREIHDGVGCLPKTLDNEKMTVLRETYILQVDQMYDISTSKYKQLQKIRNANTVNIEITDVEEHHEQKYNTKPAQKRMMQLELTDGVQNVIGIEYKYTACFNETLLPGYKILVKGPVKCRRGVLLLKENNIQGIGGEVDSLLIPNALENILARALNLEENADPYDDNASKKKNSAKTTSNILDGDFDINLEEISRIENSHKEQDTTVSVPEPTSSSSRIVNTSDGRTRDNSFRSDPVRAEKNFTDDGIQFFDGDDDDIFQSVVEPSVTNNERIIRKEPTDPGSQGCIGPYRSLPKENAASDGDDIIEIIDEAAFVEKRSSTSSDPASAKQSFNVSNPLKLSKGKQQRLSVTRGSAVKRPAATGFPPTCTKKGKVEPKITSFCKPSPVEEPPKICDFIYDVLQENVTSVLNKTVRGHITNMSGLSKNHSSWILDATISDGTASLDVSFSNTVLESIFGLDVKEFSQRKKQTKTNPEMKQELRQILRNAEQTLRDLDALLDLQLTQNEKPIVIKITELTEQQKESINRRLEYVAKKNRFCTFDNN